MPLIKQKGPVWGTQRNLNFLFVFKVFLSSTVFIEILLTAPVCCAKIETQIKLLNDDYSVPTRTKNDDSSSSLSSNIQQPPMTDNNFYKNDLKRISYETIHRILRDENEPMIYRTNDLRYFHKRSSSTTEHVISKRSLGIVLGESPDLTLNLTDRNLHVFSRVGLNCRRRLEEITSIILHKNYLREFPIRLFPNLTVLDLSQNNFSHFELPVEYNKLHFLNLNRNRIENFTILTSNISQFNNSIHDLHLKDNAIHLIGQMNLGILPELEVLDLSCNQLENLATALFPKRMKNLKYLNLAHNGLQCIYRETFYNLLSMNTLILSYNEINAIDYETFLALPNLQYLDLSHNKLKGDSIRALQGIPDLVGLSIANNPELGDWMQEFVAPWSLKELDASGTGLCKIPAILAQSVRTLILANNWLTIISCGDFDSYPLLQYLDLSNSHIEDIEEDALGRLEIIETLFLDHNHLKKIPISLPTTLEHLFLQDNQIMDIPLHSFQGLKNLRTLDLSSNKLIYFPDLSLPKLVILNLQSSGINSLHQDIVKTSPHLRDLFLEDNPIKCADLVGLTEWASPCRNDRVIAKRINIKLYYVQMHNYFERFQCIGVDGDKCVSCFGDLKSRDKEILAPPNCVDLNRPIRKKAAKSTTLFTQESTNNNKATDNPTKIHTPDRYFERSYITQSSSNAAETNQGYLKTNSNTPQYLPAAVLEVLKRKTNTGIQIQTKSINNQSTTQTQLKHGISTLFTNHPLQLQFHIKSDSNDVETNSSSPGNLLMSQENTRKTQKGSSAESDYSTQVESNIYNGISTSKTVLKSEANDISDIPREKVSIAVPGELEQSQMQRLKDRHLIGTPLLMYKGQVVIHNPQSLSGSQTIKNSKEVNLSHLKLSRYAGHLSESKERKLELKVDTHHQSYFEQQQDQLQNASKENTIAKAPTKKSDNNTGLLRQKQLNEASQLWILQQEQTIDQINDQKRFLTDNDKTYIQTRLKGSTNFSIQRIPKDKNVIHSLQKNKKKEITTKSEDRYSLYGLNTPLDTKIQSLRHNLLLKGIKDLENGNVASSTESNLADHQSQENTSFMENEDNLQALQAIQDLKKSQEFLEISMGKEEGTLAALTKLEGSLRSTEISLFQHENTVKMERWLDIRSAKRHPGLVAVIGVSFAMVFIVGLFQIYRHREKPLSYISHQQNYSYQHNDHIQTQYHSKKPQLFESYQCHHNQLRMFVKYDKKHHSSFEDNRNQCSNYSCNQDRKASPIHSNPKSLVYNLHSMHEKSHVPPGQPSQKSVSHYEFRKEKYSLGNSTYANAKQRSSSSSTFNHRLFQVNDKRIIPHHPPADHKNNVYVDINHVQQSVLPDDLFPMELLTDPSRVVSLPSSSASLSSSPSIAISSPETISATLYSEKAAAEYKGEQQKQCRRSIGVEYQQLNHQKTAAKGRSKFEIW